MTGCAQFDKALGQQQATIYFQPSTPVAFKLKVRTACNNVTPNVKAVPIATGVPLSSAVDVVTYNTTGYGTAHGCQCFAFAATYLMTKQATRNSANASTDQTVTILRLDMFDLHVMADLARLRRCRSREA